MQTVMKSLNAKIILLVALIGLAVFSIVAFIGAAGMKSAMDHQMEESVKLSVDLMARSIEKPMVVGDDEGTTEEFAALAQEYPDTLSYMVNYKGNITYSSDVSTLRTDFNAVVADAPLQAALQKNLVEDHISLTRVTLGEKTYLTEIKSIPNEKSCYHCHASPEPILGALIVMKDITPTLDAIDSQATTNVVLSVAGLLVMVGCIIVFMRITVIKRVASLAKDAEAVTKGDYSVQFNVDSNDELRVLGDSLESMVADLKNKLGFSDGVLNGIPTPCGIVGPDFTMLWSNRQMHEILGRSESPKDVVGMRSGEFFQRDASRETLSDKAIKDKEPRQAEIEYETPDGRALNIAVDTTPFYDMDGAMLGSITFWHDLTEIRRQQAKIGEQNERMGVVAREAMDIAGKLAASSEELSSQVATANEGAQRQSARAAETATAMEEMNVTVLEVARNSAHAAERAVDARDRASEGAEIVEQAIDAITRVNRQAEQMKENIHKLGGRAEDVGRIMGVISDIADQTNLLALNAAIEAARAGDAGRGFAVVADEVRKLAERTMEATQQVEQAVTSIQDGVAENIGGVDKAAEAVDESTLKANQSGEALREIVGMIETAADEVRSIATAAEEQSATSEEINRSTDEISRIAGETSHIMEESSRAVAEVSQQAAELSELIETIK